MIGNFKKFLIFNENSILISYDLPINSKLTNIISLMKGNIEKKFQNNLVEIVQSISSLLVIFDNNKISAKAFIFELKKIKDKEKVVLKSNKIWQIPVCYDIKYGVDLENLAKKKQLYPSEIIHFHKSKLYDVLSMGFLPGFMYLGFTNNQLHCERKETPSFKVNRGSIGIALNQTCIYPQDSPGGWHIIGISPLNFFDLNLKNPCFAEPGDKIEFVEISIKEYLTMKKKKSIKPKYKIDD